MTPIRIITYDVLQRVSKADQEISKWMRTNGTYEIYPESCMSILVEKNIYEYDWNNRGHYFREDLRTLRDNNSLDVFTSLIIEQKASRSKWIIKLKEG
ncbi:MAG: hypothetical protein CVU87_08145 [Firmicutes bacterium HGW-Firmicutes-12]|nr:MAG: hypothetical protein CVU87_08145 [Firmicutes bacterium HGW-Firmicutes-12]